MIPLDERCAASTRAVELLAELLTNYKLTSPERAIAINALAEVAVRAKPIREGEEKK
jgi:hypothetical protein